MGLYEQYILPHIIDKGCGSKAIEIQRGKIVPLAVGRVLEIGIGSGLNIPFYDAERVDFVWGLEPSDGMRRKAKRNLNRSGVEVKWLDLPGEELSLENDSVDTVVLTYTLCTISDWHTALQQIHRVIKPSGKLLFCEHGAAPDKSILTWQNRINPVWKIIGGGCNLNRPIPEYLQEGGFSIKTMNTLYLPKTPRIAGFNYIGVANKI
ncbi:methyltransferase type 11 [Candidatus Scalindua japonica]|uniref:Methyltransferase type 11 n=1 Tax=Candidatus Scalindua japonica TaxID=1284222 RepID=A0A286TWG4_9BACT|nr:class I SAM-dependent methyltransferase [Candidatus Scalindua japonica]GAX60204.1 methyltransferase type 11 [Candidatus Scalindua japonica]